MKETLAFGAATLAVALTLTFPRRGTGLHPAPSGEVALGSQHQDQRLTHAGRVAYHAKSAMRPSQPFDAGLLAAVETELDPDRRAEALERLVQSISDADLPVVLEALARELSSAATDLRQLLVRRWAEGDAPAAAAWAELLPEGSVRRAALEQVSIAWANADLPAATAWIQAMADSDSKAAAALSLAYEAARSEPVTALAVASALPSGPQRDDLLVHAISQWAIGDSARAADWATQVPDAVLRERLLAAVAVSAAGEDGGAAAAFAVQALLPGAEQDRAAVCIVQRWAQHSQSAAASWVAEWPDSPVRDAASQSLSALGIAHNSQTVPQGLNPVDAPNESAPGL
jgi:hypothetical protein